MELPETFTPLSSVWHTLLSGLDLSFHRSYLAIDQSMTLSPTLATVGFFFLPPPGGGLADTKKMRWEYR
jgi:hypothetical protein